MESKKVTKGYFIGTLQYLQERFDFILQLLAGATFGTMSWLQVLGGTMGTIMQNSVYAATVDKVPGAVFWLTSGIFFLAAILVL